MESLPVPSNARVRLKFLSHAGVHVSKLGAAALLAAKCCIDNNRWADFLDWRACRAAD